MSKEIDKILLAGTWNDIRDSRFKELTELEEHVSANEQARVAAETSRESAETDRADAEQARVEAEQARAEEFAGFTATLAAKENKANKVTSINADADDVHYPSAKAVKDSLAKVKNIEVTPDMLSESTKQFINASGGGTITNFADDEDLTTVDNALKLADKTYDPITYSGMGRKYLRKNLVNGKNILTQAMLPSANTIYIIQYDYDLNGATITIPENCTLDFQGGSLANGNINCNKTIIIAAPYKIFNGVELMGSFSSDIAYVEWFGAKGDGSTDDRLPIQKTFDMFERIVFQNKEYCINSYNENNKVALELPKNRIIIGNQIEHKAEGAINNIKCINDDVETVLLINGSCHIENISIKATTPSEPTSNQLYTAIKSKTLCSRVYMLNVKAEGGETGFDLSVWMLTMINCAAWHNQIGFYVHGELNSSNVPLVEITTVNMQNCYAILSKKHGYRIIGVIYSTLINCATDGCGIDWTKPTNSWDDVTAPYYFSYSKNMTLINLGCESSLKMIRTISCQRMRFIAPLIAYGFLTNDMIGGTYKPGHVFEIVYSSHIVFEHIGFIKGGIDPNAISSLLNNNPNSPIIYLEDLQKNYLAYKFLGQNSADIQKSNIQIGGLLKSSNYYYEDDEIKDYNNNYTFASGSLRSIISNANVLSLDNPNNAIQIKCTQNNFELGTYTASTIDLNGKTILVYSDTIGTSITAYAQAQSLSIKNGTLILRNFDFSGNSPANRKSLFTLDNANLVLENCKFYNISSISDDYVVSIGANSHVSALSCSFCGISKPLAKIGSYTNVIMSIPEFGNNYNSYKGTIIYDPMWGDFEVVEDTLPRLKNKQQQTAQLPNFGTISQSYGGPSIFEGCTYYYNGKIVVWTGSKWVDATGVEV